MQSAKVVTMDLGAFTRRLENVTFQFPRIQLRTPNIYDVLMTESRDLGTFPGPVRRRQTESLRTEKGAVLRSMIYLAVVLDEQPLEAIPWENIKNQDFGLGMIVRIIDQNEIIVFRAPPVYSSENITQYLVKHYVCEDGAYTKFRQDWIDRPEPWARIEIEVPEPILDWKNRKNMERMDKSEEGPMGALVAHA